MALRIEDYGLIGDTHAAALVGRNGSIDWLCLPRFDSPACFAALLGGPQFGRWLLSPACEIRQTRRRYRGHSLVLETEFECDSGVVRLVDCMPPRGHEPDLVRVVEGVEGEVPMEMDLVVRFDYGAIVPWVRRIDGCWRAIGGPDALSLHTPVALHGEDLTTRASFSVARGDRVPFLLTWHPSHTACPPGIDALAAPHETEEWWREWCGRCTYEGPWREAVIRSLITLKALTYRPTGGIVAAPTTSLPEQVGGVRNWDYRFCWLRDATFTLSALMTAGFFEEAAAWRNWLLRAVAGEPEDLQIMYGASGERRLTELVLDWLPGYEGSQPVRIGNAAVNQFQLDVYGELMDALHVGRVAGLEADTASWELQKHLLRDLERRWREPDEGIWEVRGPRRHFTHSKLMAWVAFDRSVADAERFGLDGSIEHWRRIRAEIHREICDAGYNATLGSFVQSYGSDELDASLLTMPLLGFLPADDPRVVGTIAAIERNLTDHGLVLRYAMHRESENVDGLPPGEGTFLLCTFWLADCYVMMKRYDDAVALFERALEIGNDLGLLAEQYDPVTNRMLGNFPQAFSHVGLIATALRLHEALRAQRRAGQRSDLEAS